ncbi:MAG: enoyl-CoA hydratase [bacterium]|nr:enoyl-CoA hydratase [bacterium]
MELSIYSSIETEISRGIHTIRFNRSAERNSINETFLREINSAIDAAEDDAACSLVVLEGTDGIFCTGMDFNELARDPESLESSYYMHTIKRFSLSPRIIVSKIDGTVMAGGVGLAAASDLVYATPRSQFSLSEALWGLLPACVIPYLIRRVGFQKAYAMTLTTMPVSAQKAGEMNLVDEICEDPDSAIKRLWLRVNKVNEGTVKNMKDYFRKMWLITEQMEKTAIDEISRLIADPVVRDNIENYVRNGEFPWEREKKEREKE